MFPRILKHSRRWSSTELRRVFDNKPTENLKLTTETTGLFGFHELSNPQALQKAAERVTQHVATIVAELGHETTDASWTVHRLDRLSEIVCSVVDTAEFLRNVHPDKSMVVAANETHQQLSELLSLLNVHQGLYASLKRSLDPNMSLQEKRVAELLLVDFEKSGVNLPRDKRNKFVELNNRILMHGQQFLVNAHVSNEHHVTVKVTDALMQLFPANLRRALQRSVQNGMVQIPVPSIFSSLIMSSSQDEALRKKIYETQHTHPESQLEDLAGMLKARSQLAHLVGKESYAELWLSDKMVRTSENASQFLQNLHKIVYPNAQAEYQQLAAIKQHLYPKHMHASQLVKEWDREFLMNQYSSVLETQIPQPLVTTGGVMEALDAMCSSLFNLNLVHETAAYGEVWHASVKKLRVVDATKNETVGIIYCDLIDRPGKMAGAAHFTVRCSRRTDLDAKDPSQSLARLSPVFSCDDPSMTRTVLLDSSFRTVADKHTANASAQLQVPIVVLSMNLRNGPMGWREASTIFHEFGHALHSMLGATAFQHIAGTRVPMDFVEVPSTLFELLGEAFLFHRNGITPPKQPFEHLEHLQQLLLAMMDQQFHSSMASRDAFDTTKMAHQLTNQWGLFPGVSGTTPHASFSHLFTYGASYYSYFWSRVLAQRIYQRLFADQKSESWHEGGALLHQHVLGTGGSHDPWDSLYSMSVVSEVEREKEMLMDLSI